MNKADFQTFLRDTFEKEIISVSKAGQAEYALSTEDAFDNFNRLAAELKLDRKQVLMVYFSKHRDGIISYINGHTSQRESVEGRIKDAIMYLFLLWGMVVEENRIEDVIDTIMAPPIAPSINEDAIVRAFRETSMFWAPELMDSPTYILKLYSAMERAAYEK